MDIGAEYVRVLSRHELEYFGLCELGTAICRQSRQMSCRERRDARSQAENSCL